MFPLILTILCSTSITLILKYNDEKKGTPIVLLISNYFVATLISLSFLLLSPSKTYSFSTMFFGAFLAFVFVFSFFVFTKAVAVAGAALASVSARLSVIIPIIFSMLIFHEQPKYNQITGFVFTLLTILLFYYSLITSSQGKLALIDYFYLLFLLIGIGLNDFCLKIFEQTRPRTDTPFFLFSIFVFAFVYTSAYVLVKRIRVTRQTLLIGTVLGVPNIFSSFFLLGALAKLPAIIVYPVTNIGIILLTTLGAAIIWKERLNVCGKWALVVGLIAIFLLSF